MPSRALLRSVHAGSLPPECVWHIEPVRSSTSITSSGFDAARRAGRRLGPNGELVDPEHLRELRVDVGALLDGDRVDRVAARTDAMHFVDTESRRPAMLSRSFLPPVDAPYSRAIVCAGSVRQAPGARKGGGVGRRLQRAMRVVGVPDVDHHAAMPRRTARKRMIMTSACPPSLGRTTCGGAGVGRLNRRIVATLSTS